MEPLIVKILDAVILENADHVKKVNFEQSLFCFIFSGLKEPECKKIWKDRLLRATEEGLINRTEKEVSLTALGEKKLSEVRRGIIEDKKTIQERLKKLLSPVAGEGQAEIFQERIAAVQSLMDRARQNDQEDAQITTCEYIMIMRLLSMLKNPEDQLVKDVRDIIDLCYTHVITIQNRRKYSDRPKIPHVYNIQWRKIDRGLWNSRISTNIRTGPIHINILRINPKYRQVLTIDCSAYPKHERSLKKLCKKHGAQCGTSGGFFLYSEPGLGKTCFRGDPVGLIISEGRVVNPPIFNRSALHVSEKGHVSIQRMGMKGVTIVVGKAVFIVKKVNSVIRKGEIGIFTPLWGNSFSDQGKYHFSITGTKVVEVSSEPLPIPINGFVVSIDSGPAPLGAFGDICPGDRVEYSLPDLYGSKKIISAMAGGPSLVIGGSKTIDFDAEQFGKGIPPVTFSEDSSIGQSLLPRLAWGITKNHELIACAVDGRNLDQSVGMTLKQVAQFMLKLDCTDAINMDGGSTKRMVVKGRSVDYSSTSIVLDSNSYTPKRPLSSAVLVI